MKERAGPVNLPGSYLVLELTNHCPLRCIHCVRSREGFPHFLEKGYMDPSLPVRLARELRERGYFFDNLILFWLGEPLVHPGFETIFRGLVRENSPGAGPFGRFELHTNGLALDQRLARLLSRPLPFPFTIHFSLDAIVPETYRAIKGGDHLKEVMDNVEGMMRLKGEQGGRGPALVFQFIVCRRNAGEAGEFSGYWKEKGSHYGLSLEETGFFVPPSHGCDFIFFRQKDCPTREEQEEENRVYFSLLRERGLLSGDPPLPGSAMGEENLNTCSGFFKSPVVGWDGKVTLCTRDSLFELCIGDLKRVDFHDLWWLNEGLWRWRERVAGGDYSLLPPCRSCFIPLSSNYTGIEEEEMERFLRGRP